MDNRQRVWLWSSAAISIIVGFILVMNDSSAGWFLIILGITYLGISTRAGQSWAASNPNLFRWGFILATLLLFLLVVLVGSVLLLR